MLTMLSVISLSYRELKQPRKIIALPQCQRIWFNLLLSFAQQKLQCVYMRYVLENALPPGSNQEHLQGSGINFGGKTDVFQQLTLTARS